MFANKPTEDVEAQPLQFVKRGALLYPSAFRNMVEHRQRMRWRRHRGSQPSRLLRKNVSGLTSTSSMESAVVNTDTTQQASNPMRFLQETCPEDVLPTVLALVGPQTMAALYQTNRHWRAVLDRENTWKRLCQELYKVGRCEVLFACLWACLLSACVDDGCTPCVVSYLLSCFLRTCSHPFPLIKILSYSGKKETENQNPGKTFTVLHPASPSTIPVSKPPCDWPMPLLPRDGSNNTCPDRYDRFAFSCALEPTT